VFFSSDVNKDLELEDNDLTDKNMDKNPSLKKQGQRLHWQIQGKDKDLPLKYRDKDTY
jgi:hypothetical protein